MRLSDEEIIVYTRGSSSDDRRRALLTCLTRVRSCPGDIVVVGIPSMGVLETLALKGLQIPELRRAIHVYEVGESECRDEHVDRVAQELQGRYPGQFCFHFGGKHFEKIYEFPSHVALFRLEADDYTAVYSHLLCFASRVVDRGAVIIEGYAHSEACRTAVFEYIVNLPPALRPVFQVVEDGVHWIQLEHGRYALRKRVQENESTECVAPDVRLYDHEEEMLTAIQPKGKVAVLGVFRGDSAEMLLRICPGIEQMHLVDPYEGEVSVRDEVAHWNHELLPYVQDRFRKETRVQHHRMRSTMFWSALPENYLEAVYIDGVHTNEDCLQDLEEARRVVQPGGWIMGRGLFREGQSGVNRAVNEFCATYNLTVSHVSLEGCTAFALVNEKEKGPKIAVASMAVNDTEAGLATYMVKMQKNLESHRAYCARHGYTYELREGLYTPLEGNTAPFWIKLLHLRELCLRYEYVLWVDADARFQAMDRSLALLLPMLHDTKASVLVGMDDLERLQVGVLLLKGGSATAELLTCIGNHVSDADLSDEAAFNTLYKEEPSFRERLVVLPPQAMYLLQSPPHYKNPQEALLLHFSGFFRPLMDLSD